jgi:NAD+ synthase
MARPPDFLRIAVAQLNPVVGDIAGNLALAREAYAEATVARANLLVFSELFISGYPPEDLILRRSFLNACRVAVEDLAAETKEDGPAIIVGAPWPDGTKVFNAAILLCDGAVAGLRAKVKLPNYGVFDEPRVFTPGPLPIPFHFRGMKIGVPICEDMWDPAIPKALTDAGADILVVPNASPYWRGKAAERQDVARERVQETELPLLYVNQVGGQDELVFDGGSFGMDGDGGLALQLPFFESALTVAEFTRVRRGWQLEGIEARELPGANETDWRATALGIRDYVEKNRFPGVLLGLSGGADSALCAALAVDALGPERVRAFMLPYVFTSRDSLEDAAACAKALGIRHDVIDIAGTVDAAKNALAPLFAGRPSDLTEENLQSRTRGLLLMALSNKFGSLLLTTGNKSEVSVGYATLYGDMNGGFNPVKDLYKTEIYRLAGWRNELAEPDGLLGPPGPVIPERILTKAPTAELRANQTDQDSLPPYEVLDDILKCLVEGDMSTADIIGRGIDAATVKRVEHLLYVAEYKRRQAAPGPKISRRNFGRDRRYPITNRFRDPA